MGTTTYSEKHEPITLNDFPTMAICMDFEKKNLIFGQDILIDVKLITEQGDESTALLIDRLVSLHSLKIN